MNRKRLGNIVSLCVIVILFLFILCLIRKNRAIYHIKYHIISCDNKVMEDGEQLAFAPGEHTIIVSLDGRYIINSIQPKWSDKISDVNIFSTDYCGAKRWAISKDTHASYLLICFSNEENVGLIDLKINGKKNYEKCIGNDSYDIVYDEFDGRNPLSVYRIPMTSFAWDLANEILGDNEYSDHQKIMKFMYYLQDYDIGNFYCEGEEYLYRLAKEKIGACGDYCNMLAALNATQGIETKIIALANYPANSGHVVVSSYVNGKWCMYDPTYCMYYAYNTENDEPYVLSLDEIKEYYSNDNYTNNGQPSRIICSEKHIVSENSYHFMGPDIYLYANPQGEIGPLNKLQHSNIISCGEKLVIKDISSVKYQGAQYIGIAAKTISQKWEIVDVVPNKEYNLNLVISGMGGEIFNPLDCYCVSDDALILSGNEHSFHAGESETYYWEIKFIPIDSKCSVVFDFDEISEKFHYVSIDYIEVVTK